MRTLLDRNRSDRPQRRTALIANELERYNIDIAALSETRLAGEGELRERSADYTFFCSGREPEEKREAGVGFAMRTALVKQLTRWSLEFIKKQVKKHLDDLELDAID